MSDKNKRRAGRELAAPKGGPRSELPSTTDSRSRSPLAALDPERRKQIAKYGTGAGALLVGAGVALPYFAPATAASLGNGGLWALKLVGIALVVGAWLVENAGRKRR